jgi:hypothetical protein
MKARAEDDFTTWEAGFLAAADAWSDNNCDPDLLLRGPVLDESRRRCKGQRQRITAFHREFLIESIRQEDLQQLRWVGGWVIGLVGALCLVVFLFKAWLEPPKLRTELEELRQWSAEILATPIASLTILFRAAAPDARTFHRAVDNRKLVVILELDFPRRSRQGQMMF